jgi:Zn-dependent alcohol dehydrogenase
MMDFLNQADKAENIADGIIEASIDYDQAPLFDVGQKLHKNAKRMKLARAIFVGGGVSAIGALCAWIASRIIQIDTDPTQFLSSEEFIKMSVDYFIHSDASFPIDSGVIRTTIQNFYAANETAADVAVRVSKYLTGAGTAVFVAGVTYYEALKIKAGNILGEMKPHSEIFGLYRNAKNIDASIADSLMRAYYDTKTQ